MLGLLRPIGLEDRSRGEGRAHGGPVCLRELRLTTLACICRLERALRRQVQKQDTRKIPLSPRRHGVELFSRRVANFCRAWSPLGDSCCGCTNSRSSLTSGCQRPCGKIAKQRLRHQLQHSTPLKLRSYFFRICSASCTALVTLHSGL